jgi:hypothetical protein
MRDVFLLGCERSGSTWLANIFDAHPDVELIMEPFADYARLFPAIPDRNSHVCAATRGHREELEAGYAQLTASKYPLLYRPGRPLWLRRAEQHAASAMRRASQRAFGRATLAQDRYQLLQINSTATPWSRLSRKQRRPAARITKELRLNFKAPLLHAAFPGSRFVVIIRHPGAQIASILRWMQRGHLKELGRALETFDARIAEQDRFATLAEACGGLAAGQTVEQRLARWWALNYTVLLEDLDRCGASYRVTRHDRLAEDPPAESARLLDFAGLDPSAAVDRYVAWSSHTAPRRFAPTETVRRSAESSAEAIHNVPTRVTKALACVAERLARAKLLHEQLADCLSELER